MDPRAHLAGLIFAFMPAQLVHAMARLRIADVVADGPMTIDELSVATNTQPDMLRRLVRGLTGLGLVTAGSDGRVSVTEMGALLASDAPGSLRDAALHGGREGYLAWAQLEQTLRTGEPAFQAAFGEPIFSYLRSHPDAGTAFDGMMTQLSHEVIPEAIAEYDFGGVRRILDVGGGLGHFVAAVLNAHPELEGGVFDVPEVAEAAAAYLARMGLAHRCVTVAGSFFESLPTGFDMHLLKWILHDWNDDACRKLLQVCRAALPDHGRLVVVERLLPDETPTSGLLDPAIALDLNMMVTFADARERRLNEYEHLLASCGLAVQEVIALPSGFSILDCRLPVA